MCAEVVSILRNTKDAKVLRKKRTRSKAFRIMDNSFTQNEA